MLAFERPSPVEQHPMHMQRYLIPTPSIDQMMARVKWLARMHTPGALIYAYPRFGKSKGILYVIYALQDEFPGLVCVNFGCEFKTKPSEDAFFTMLLEAVDHKAVSTGRVSAKRRRLVERLAQRVDESGYSWFVVFADEAQRLSFMEYEWLRDVHDKLERKGIRMITLLVGQPQLLNQKSALRAANHTQIILRFMVAEMKFDGIKNVETLAACIKGYDDARYPIDSNWSYTRFFFPIAYHHGFRLEQEAVKLWRAFQASLGAAKLNLNMEIPMQYVAHTVEIAFEHYMDTDAANFVFTDQMWEFAVKESYFSDAQRELAAGAA